MNLTYQELVILRDLLESRIAYLTSKDKVTDDLRQLLEKVLRQILTY